MSTVAAVKQQVAKKEITTVLDFMESKRDLIAKALPNTITPDRLIGVFTMLLKSSPALMECSQASLVGAVIQTVQVGLTPGPIGHVYYVPFNNKQRDGSYHREVQFIIGYKGMIELVNRSGKACILTAECVYSNDQFQHEQGLNPVLRHTPASGERGDFAGVYCIAKNMMANEKVFVYLAKDEVEKVRSASKAGNTDYSPWAKWFDEMAKKTAVKRICKMLPLSLDVQQKISTDETVKTEIDREMVSVPDKTEWNGAEEAETVDSPHKDAVTVERIPAQEEQSQAETTQDLPKLKDVPIGQMVAEFDGLVTHVRIRELKNGKNKQITDYTVELSGEKYVVSRFGAPREGSLGAVCIFGEVEVSEFKGERKYLAREVEVK